MHGRMSLLPRITPQLFRCSWRAGKTRTLQARACQTLSIWPERIVEELRIISRPGSQCSVDSSTPIILTLDRDVQSNDPKTPHHVLCYLLGSYGDSRVDYV